MSRSLALRSVRAVFALLLVVLAWAVPGPAATAVPAESFSSAYSYDAPTDSSSLTSVKSLDGVAVGRPYQPSVAGSAGEVSAAPAVFVAADTAATDGVNIGKTTAHGAERVAGAGATRGVLTTEQIVQVRGTGQIWSQADGATVRVLQNDAGRYNVVVDGERGLITTFSNLSQKSFDRLAGNYGWTP